MPDRLEKLLQRNREWAARVKQDNPQFFEELS